MKPISRKGIKKYFLEVLNKDSVVRVINECGKQRNTKMYKDFMPELSIDNTIKGFRTQVAGFTVGVSQVHIAQWILANESEAKGVIRHEVAHLVQHYLNGECQHHGKEFTSALKVVSPRSWRKDRHWHDSPEIAKARKECEKNPTKIYLT